ncbi:lycopene cyclase domain-containing protein [Mucilaginibacter calamicampi]|uniref:Lycopene cyclase domain-containing protein n=1 Tax=Mucilaginibacter calamicampi TaxID=1302352 RepID=A0ABW2YRD9_9SPHI
MIKYTYLLIDLLSVLVPLLVSFHPRSGLYKYWYALLPAIVITSLCYVIWDSCFTHLGIWGFNKTYLTGIYIGNLPLEEIFFFICIPYSCVFTFDCLTRVIKPTILKGALVFINYGLVTGLIILAGIFHKQYYTGSAFVLMAVLIILVHYKKVSWLGQFYVVYAILLIPFLIVNGLLTGTGLSAPVVWYNPEHIMGPRILTIPVEDVFYGMGLVLINTWLYQWLRNLSKA